MKFTRKLRKFRILTTMSVLLLVLDHARLLPKPVECGEKRTYACVFT